MSHIKTDKISARTASGTITIGESGETISFASGTTISGIEGVPAGVIAIWSGAISVIPSGWYLCDGTNGTPNLTARFVIHADADSAGTYNVGDTGGSTTSGAHTLSTAEIPAHTHTYTFRTMNYGHEGAVAWRGDQTRNTGSTGGGGSHSHANTIPPYYALAYIMKG